MAITSISRYQWWYGRDEPPLISRALRAGSVTARLVGRDLRSVRFGATEIAQRIYVALRDRNWGTVPGEITDLVVDDGEDRFAVRLTVTHRQHDIDLTWKGEILGQPDGTISYAMDAVAGSDMTYKLIGLNIHHGMKDYAGRPCQGMTTEGPISDAFSVDVAPQLIVDETEVPIFPPVESLTAHLADGISVRFDFEGDTFEFEDQRNWTDASFKSQSYPPRRGGLNTISVGEHVRQKVTMMPFGAPSPVIDTDEQVRIEVGETIAGRVPPIGFGMASHGRGLSGEEADLLAALSPAHLRADLRLADPGYPAELARSAADAAALDCGLELAVHLSDDAEGQLADLAPRLTETERINRILVFHTAEPATGPRWVALARNRLQQAVPHARFAGGTDANFCELNRFRPSGTPDDGIVYAISPQVHAFDEQSLAENIAAQGETVATARAFGGGRPIIVSPITLKPRFNAVATSDEPAVMPGELPPQVDPRQMSLFAAGWTTGSLRQLLERGVEAATYYETTGWRGVIQGDEPSPVPERFPAFPGMVFPLYHVFADLAEWKDGQVLASRSSNPFAVEALAVTINGRLHLMLANLTPDPQTVAIGAISGEVALRRLNADTAEESAFAPARYRLQTKTITADGAILLTLAPFEVTRLDARASGTAPRNHDFVVSPA